MSTRRTYRGAHGAWDVAFAVASSRLTCTHRASKARVEGALSVEATMRGGTQRLAIDVSRDTVPDRLALIDTNGDVQGYLQIVGSGSALEILCMHRAAQNFPGVLSLHGTAQLGNETFACRTAAAPQSNVVQMASGPADSALNDSIFDVPTDTALRLSGATASITTMPGKKKGKARFCIRMTARPEAAAGHTLRFECEEDYYRSRYVPYYRPIDKRRCPSPPTGWMSWNVYFDQAGEKENLAEARIAAKHLKPFGLEIWSIESWQENSPKLPVRTFHNLNLKAYGPQFPHGMKWLADQIRKLGFMPGIWTAPFGTGNEEFYKAHKGWFLHDAHGKPMSNWCGNYLLDPSQPAVRKHMKQMHRTMSRDWGYEFFKIDGMSGRSKGYSAHCFERPEVRNAFKQKCKNPFELCVKAFREGIGADRIFLACQGHYSGPDVTYADAGRIGGDIVSPNQPSRWHNLISSATATLNQLFVNNIVWYGDPDTLLVGTYHAMARARIATTIVALPGQLMFAGDKLGELPKERMRLLQQSLPVCDVRPLDLYPVFDLCPIWDLKIRRPFGEWDVVSLFNWGEQRKKIVFSFEELGLPADGTYLLYDFWQQRFLGAKQKRYAATLPAHSSQLLAVHPALGRPQFLSTDRHITQGGVSLEEAEWDEKKATLRGAVKLVKDHPVDLVFHIPEGFTFRAATARHARVRKATMRKDRTLVLTFKSDRTCSAAWRIAFTRT